MRRIGSNCKRRVITIIVCFLCYLILGAIIPFAIPREVSQENETTFDVTQFTNQEESHDRAAIIENSVDALDLRIAMIEQAKEHIILSSYDIRDGESTKDIFAALFHAANRGVKIQILVDGLCGMVHMGKENIFYVMGAHKNIEIRFYNTPSVVRPWTVNGRMHDKYLIIDGKLLLLGGRNTFDYFLGDYNMAALSDDREILIYNGNVGSTDDQTSVIHQTKEYFRKIWQLDCNKTMYVKVPFYKEEQVQKIEDMLLERYQKLQKEKVKLFQEISWKEQTVAIKKATLITNPTHIYKKEPILWYQIQQLMLQANQRIWFHTPYIVMDKAMKEGMKQIAKRPITIDLLINSVAVGDNVMASSDYLTHREEIVAMGANIYESFGQRSSHGKSILIDDTLAVIGSYNLDMRSTYIDTEVAIVVYGEEFNRQLEQVLGSIRNQSLQVSEDGTYVRSNTVKERDIDKKKEWLLKILGVVTRGIRFLL